jgi:hypothetical protein
VGCGLRGGAGGGAPRPPPPPARCNCPSPSPAGTGRKRGASPASRAAARAAPGRHLPSQQALRQAALPSHTQPPRPPRRGALPPTPTCGRRTPRHTALGTPAHRRGSNSVKGRPNPARPTRPAGAGARRPYFIPGAARRGAPARPPARPPRRPALHGMRQTHPPGGAPPARAGPAPAVRRRPDPAPMPRVFRSPGNGMNSPFHSPPTRRQATTRATAEPPCAAGPGASRGRRLPATPPAGCAATACCHVQFDTGPRLQPPRPRAAVALRPPPRAPLSLSRPHSHRNVTHHGGPRSTRARAGRGPARRWRPAPGRARAQAPSAARQPPFLGAALQQ